jgi:predicted phosphohydrolase
MALYAIGDLHLSLSCNKSMEVFGEGWRDYVARIEDALSRLTADDTLVLAGDTSWGMSLGEAEADFRFLDRFPGRKLLVKGNHDYWWTTVAKMKRFLEEAGITSLDFLHNNCFSYGDWALCGTRGWFLEENQKPQDAKVLNREVMRLETSLRAAGGAAHFVLSPLSAPLPGLSLPGDPGAAGAVRRAPVLLRPSPRPHHPPGHPGMPGRRGVFPHLRGQPGVSPKKNLRLSEKSMAFWFPIW